MQVTKDTKNHEEHDAFIQKQNTFGMLLCDLCVSVVYFVFLHSRALLH